MVELLAMTQFASVHGWRLQVTSGYLNYSALVDIYRAGPRMKCLHTQGHELIIFDKPPLFPMAAEVILAQSPPPPSAVRVDT